MSAIPWVKARKDRLVQAECGHYTARQGTVKFNGEEYELKVPRNQRRISCCLDCMADGAISCAWCHKAIFFGDAITLRTPSDPNYKGKEGTVLYHTDPLQVVGCLRCDGIASVVEMAGYWMRHNDGFGHIQRERTMLEVALGMDFGAAVLLRHVTSAESRVATGPDRHAEIVPDGEDAS